MGHAIEDFLSMLGSGKDGKWLPLELVGSSEKLAEGDGPELTIEGFHE